MPAQLTPAKLQAAIRASDQELDPFRTQYRDAVKLYHGRFYGGRGGKRQVINLINRQVTVLTSHLASGDPTHVVTTRRMQFRAAGILQGLMLDQLSAELKRHAKSERLLLDGCFGPCMAARVGIRAGAELVKIDGVDYDPGQPYVRRISLDDLIFDPSARDDEERLFMGERYRIGVESAVESGLFPGHEDYLRGLPKLDTPPTMERQEDEGRRSSRFDAFGLVDRIQLADIAIYDDRTTYIATVVADPRVDDGRILRIEEFQGPEGGPFIKQLFWPIPETPWGNPLVAVAREQAELVNLMLEKLTRQLERLKSVLLATPQGQTLATDIKEADDGEVILTGDPSSVRVENIDAVTPALAEFANTMQALWNEQTNGIEVMGGTGDSETATEYQGKSQKASVMLAKLTLSHERMENEISRQLAFYMTSDPLMAPAPLVYRLPGGEFIQVEYTPEQRENDFSDFTYKIRSLSMSSAMQDPNLKQRRIIESVIAIGQTALVSAQTGGLIDLPATARVLARQQGVEELDEIVADPMLLQMQAQLYQGVPQPSMGTARGPAVPGMNAGNSYRIAPPGGTSNRNTSMSPRPMRGGLNLAG